MSILLLIAVFAAILPPILSNSGSGGNQNCDECNNLAELFEESFLEQSPTVTVTTELLGICPQSGKFGSRSGLITRCLE